MADELPISYDKRELRSIITAFKAMDDEAVDAAKRESFALAGDFGSIWGKFTIIKQPSGIRGIRRREGL